MKSKIVLTLTAVVLVAAGVFAGIKKYLPFQVYSKSIGGTCTQLIASNISAFFKNTAGTLQAVIRTVGGSLVTQWSTAASTSKKLYLNN